MAFVVSMDHRELSGWPRDARDVLPLADEFDHRGAWLDRGVTAHTDRA